MSDLEQLVASIKDLILNYLIKTVEEKEKFIETLDRASNKEEELTKLIERCSEKNQYSLRNNFLTLCKHKLIVLPKNYKKKIDHLLR